jgi:hypothetical protein
MTIHRGWSHGATFDWQRIKAELATETWEADAEDESIQVRRVWLGTIFGITPSCKMYTPFACSNVLGDCKACGGTGKREPRTGKRARKRAIARQHRFAQGTAKRGFMYSPAGRAYAARVRKMRHAAFVAADTTCSCCDGSGSASAARDERWNEALEAEAEAIGAYVDRFDDSIAIAQSRDASEAEDESEESEVTDARPTWADGNL